MQNPMLMHLPLKGDLIGYDRNGEFTATASGPVRWKPRAGGTINYIKNPSFETGTTGWSFSNVPAGVTAVTTRVQENVTSGDWAWRVEITASDQLAGAALGLIIPSGGVFGGHYIPITAGQQYTLSADLVISGSLTVQVNTAWFDRAGGYISESSTLYTASGRGAHTGTAPAGAAYGRAMFRVQSPINNGLGTVWIDAIQYEPGATASPYIDGDSENCQWINLNTYMPGTAHASPSAHVEYFAEEATTNYVRNPRGGSTSFWSILNGTRTFNTGVDDPLGLGTSITITANGAGTVNTVEQHSSGQNVAAGQPWTLSGYVRGKGTGVGKTLLVQQNETGGSVGDQSLTSGAADIVLPSTWQQFSITGTIVQADRTQIYFFMQIVGAANGDGFELTGLQWENKAYATSYCDGSLGTGYTWAGTAHASASSRAATTLTFPSANRISENAGTIAIRMTPGHEGFYESDGLFRSFLYADFTGNNLRIYRSSNGALFTFRVGGNTQTANVTHGLATDDASEQTLIMEWEVGELATLYAAGLSSQTVSPITTPDLASNVQIAPNGAGVSHRYSISDVVIFNRPLTDAERAVLAAADDWMVEILDHLQPRFGGVMRLGPSIGLAVSSVAAPAAIAIARAIGEL